MTPRPRPFAVLRRCGPLAVFLALALAWSLLLVEGHLSGRKSPLDRLEAVSLDWRYALRGPVAAPDNLLVVGIDEAALERFGDFPIPRQVLAEAVERAAALGAAAVALDVLVVSPGPGEADAALARALGKVPAVVAAAGLFGPDGADEEARERLRWRPRAPVAAGFLWPRPQIAAAALVGAVNVSTDAGGAPRHLPLLVAWRDRAVPSLALGAAGLAAGGALSIGEDRLAIAGREVPLDLGGHLAIGFYGPARTVATVSLVDLVEGRVPPDRLAGRIVVIGPTAPAAGDTFPTPFDRAMPGVELMATAIGNLTGHGALDRGKAVRRADAAIALVLPLLVVATLAWRRTAAGYAWVAALLGGFALCLVLAFERGIWLSAALPLMAAAPPAIAFAAFSVWRERRVSQAASRARDALARLHSPALAGLLARDPDFLSEPETREAAVLFFDVAGFTGLSERIGPKATVRFQNELMDAADRAVLPEGGETMSFLGDGAMVVFGLPEPRANEPAHALSALVALDRELSALLDAWSAQAPEPLSARYGLNLGPLSLSRIGTTRQATVTVSGDTINVAARLMEIARDTGARIAVADSLVEAALARAGPADAARVRALAARLGPPAEVAVRGRAAPLAVRLGPPG